VVSIPIEIMTSLTLVLDSDPQQVFKVKYFSVYNRYTIFHPVSPKYWRSKDNAILIFKELLDKISWRILRDSTLDIYNDELTYDAVVKYIDASAQQITSVSRVCIRGRFGVFVWRAMCDLVGADVTCVVMKLMLALEN
jgi:hypothetical protein